MTGPCRIGVRGARTHDLGRGRRRPAERAVGASGSGNHPRPSLSAGTPSPSGTVKESTFFAGLGAVYPGTMARHFFGHLSAQ